MPDTYTRPKAIREGYSPNPFTFRQVSEHGTRVVAWTGNIQQLKRGLLAALERFPDTVEILLKTETDAASERGGWRRFLGMTDKPTLVDLASACEQLVFSDGGSILCIRRVDTGEYLALDEHGILFVYSSDTAFMRVLEQIGFERRVEALLYEAAHWHIRPPKCEEQEQWFIDRLGLEYVP